ncbi:hypothetical protein WBG99_01030 [Streptomyces sp. TG1A-60]
MDGDALAPQAAEWAVHPGLGFRDAREIDGGWLVRRTDHEFLTSS